MKWDCVLFDLDGTLLDTSQGVLKSVEYTINKLNLNKISEEKLKTFIGPPIYESFRSEYNLDDNEVEKATEIFREIYKSKYLLEARPYDGIYDLLEELHKLGYKLAVATNKRHDYAMTLLKEFGFCELFDYICGSDYQNTMKKADIINKCLVELGVRDTKRAIIVGDTIHDYNGAQKTGIEFVGVGYGFGFHDPKDFYCLNGRVVLSGVDELKKFFEII